MIRAQRVKGGAAIRFPAHFAKGGYGLPGVPCTPEVK